VLPWQDTLRRLEYSLASMMLKSLAAPYACIPLRSNCLPVNALFQSAGAYDSAIDLHAFDRRPTHCTCVTDWVMGTRFCHRSIRQTDICKHQLTKAHDIPQQSKNDAGSSDSPQVDYPRWCILLQILQQQVCHVKGSKVINAHGDLKIFLSSVIRWYEHACRNRVSPGAKDH